MDEKKINFLKGIFASAAAVGSLEAAATFWIVSVPGLWQIIFKMVKQETIKIIPRHPVITKNHSI